MSDYEKIFDNLVTAISTALAKHGQLMHAGFQAYAFLTKMPPEHSKDYETIFMAGAQHAIGSAIDLRLPPHRRAGRVGG